MNLENLDKILTGEPKYRASQISEAIFKDLIENWNNALNLPLNLREKLEKETHPVFCDFYQQWTIIKHKNKKYFARAIAKYFTDSSKKKVLWASGIKTTYFHRPFSVYFEYLKKAGFYISDIREIITKKESN